MRLTLEFDDGGILTSEDVNLTVVADGYGYGIDGRIYSATYTLKEKEESTMEIWPFDELYENDLNTLNDLLPQLDHLMDITGVDDAEIRVRLYGSKTWIVLGYGEAGDPAVIGFELSPEGDHETNSLL